MRFDRAGKEYWDQLWGNRPIPKAIDPGDQALQNYPNTRFHAFFSELFAGLAGEARLLEVGCAGSEWLPYFRNQFGFDVCGLDYSEIGCEQSRAVLKAAGAEGRIILGDFFNPPAAMIDQFDIVVSFGVMEHFDDTTSAVKAASLLAKPGGMIITVIPNMAGVIGRLQKSMSKAIFDKHVAVDRRGLEESHKDAGLGIVRCHYFLSTSFGVVNISDATPGAKLKVFAHLWLTRLSKLIWMLERHSFDLPATAFFAPYVICVGRKGNGIKADEVQSSQEHSH